MPHRVEGRFATCVAPASCCADAGSFSEPAKALSEESEAMSEPQELVRTSDASAGLAKDGHEMLKRVLEASVHQTRLANGRVRNLRDRGEAVVREVVGAIGGSVRAQLRILREEVARLGRWIDEIPTGSKDSDRTFTPSDRSRKTVTSGAKKAAGKASTSGRKATTRRATTKATQMSAGTARKERERKTTKTPLKTSKPSAKKAKKAG